VLHPPQSLIAALVGTTAIITGALVWAGWRLLDQQRAIDDQRARERLESAADTLASGITGRLADAGDRLSVWLSNPDSAAPGVEGAAVAVIRESGTATSSGVALPFLPAVEPARPAPAMLAGIEQLEFAMKQPAAAARRYRALASAADRHVRAEALVRLCRVLRTLRDFDAALACARQLASAGGVRAGLLPAELAGLEAERLVLRAMSDRKGELRAAARIRDAIDGGRWALPRGVAEFYREEIAGPGPADAWTLARAIDDVWRMTGTGPVTRGRRIVAAGGRNVLVMWRANERAAALLAVFEDRFLGQAGGLLRWHLSDPEGRVIAGTAVPPQGSVVRIVGDSADPWTLHVAALPEAGLRSAGPRRVLFLMMAATLAFVWAAAYFIVRAIRREAHVARLQSDFVNAVSHEFRSPLTTIRQMAEMLETGRVAAADRRETYYRVISRESARLQHLVETLLNFGRIQEGAGRYRFAAVDAAAVIAAAVGDVEAQASGKGTRIVTGDATDGAPLRGDEPSLRLAVSNLIDNAVKYSPAGSVVRVACRIEDGRAAISVEDAGPGIPRSEQPAIFRKFVRGQAAVEANIKGTGVGLSLVQEIARAHHGEIRLDSDSGRGSVFTLLLPLAEQDAGAAS
jgi:signal transduction histidine kinase